MIPNDQSIAKRYTKRRRLCDVTKTYVGVGHVVWRVVRFIFSQLCLAIDKYPIVDGDHEFYPEQPTVLVCGHAAGKEIFGAERSFVDVIRSFSTLRFNVLVAIPLTSNRDYLRTLREFAHLVCLVPFQHRKSCLNPSPRVVRRLSRLIQKYQAKAVHVNTIMLYEPLLSAQQCGIPAVVHVREALFHDAELRRHINLSAKEIRRQVLYSADYIVANSIFTAKNFTLPKKTFVVPNTVDFEELDIINHVIPENIKIGLISSNTPKKGIFELVELIRLLSGQLRQAQFLMIGPITPYVRSIQKQLNRKPLPNLLFTGYATSPLVAVQQVNIVISLSNYEESFGRTVLEAMAARRPVLVYDWGALPDLVDEGNTGFIVPYRNLEVMAQKLIWLCLHPEEIVRMGEAGRIKAVEEYGRKQIIQSLGQAYVEILGLKPE